MSNFLASSGKVWATKAHTNLLVNLSSSPPKEAHTNQPLLCLKCLTMRRSSRAKPAADDDDESLSKIVEEAEDDDDDDSSSDDASSLTSGHTASENNVLEEDDDTSVASTNSASSMGTTMIRKETSHVKRWRCVVILALIGVGVLVTVGTYLFLQREQERYVIESVSWSRVDAGVVTPNSLTHCFLQTHTVL